MKVTPSAQDDVTQLEQLVHLRHELLTRINHIIGFTEVHIEEAPEAGLLDCVPALAEINTGGRTLLAIIEDELAAVSRPSDLQRLDARIASEGEPRLALARKLAAQLNTIGRHDAAEEVNLVSSALESLLAISHGMVRK